MTDVLIPTLKEAVMITAFVLIMMVVIEYINVQSKNEWASRLQKLPYLQIVIAALLGVTPGCMGAFTVVSLYIHRLMELSGLVTVMIATSGDEAFVMLALFPAKTLLLNAALFLIALITGLVVHLLTNRKLKVAPHGFVIHKQEYCNCFSRSGIIAQLKAISFERTLLLLLTSLILMAVLAGVIGSSEWDWEKVTLLSGTLFLLFVFATVPDHFLKEHLYNHLLKKHLLRIFLWTWGAFLILHFIQTQTLLNNLLHQNQYLMLLIAVLVGMIPESGPQLIFTTLFFQNLIPFSILLTNSIVQDGHGMLPLLAESRKDFVKVKLINMIVGLVTGFILLQFGI